MATRLERLKKLVTVQNLLKDLHETRHAGFVATAASARAEADDIAARADAGAPMAAIFPDVYTRRVSAAMVRESVNLGQAEIEARRVATAILRTNRVERAYRDESRANERAKAERESLEVASRRAGDRPK